MPSQSGTDPRAEPGQSFKERLKKFPRFYHFLEHIISPVCTLGAAQHLIKQFWAKIPENGLVINAGSGSVAEVRRQINLDMTAYPNVHVLGDLQNLCFKPSSVDGIVCLGVLEHVPDIERAWNEMSRVVRPGGHLMLMMPFMLGYHGAPHDYWRLTQAGIERLMAKDWEAVGLRCIGPTSALLWIMQEWLAIVFSFGISRLRLFWVAVLMILTFPLKYLDLLLAHHPDARNISGGFGVLARRVPRGGE